MLSPATLAARGFLSANPPASRPSTATPSGSASVPTGSASVPLKQTSGSTSANEATKNSNSLLGKRMRMLSSLQGPDVTENLKYTELDRQRDKDKMERRQLERTLKQMFPSRPPSPPQSASTIEKDIRSLERQLSLKKRSLEQAKSREAKQGPETVRAPEVRKPAWEFKTPKVRELMRNQ
jgi:hypothetical protein